MNTLINVPFYNAQLTLIDHDGAPMVAMKPIVENIGLDWKSQHAKISERFNSTMVIITTVGEDGKNREMLCLPLRKVPAWLFSVNPKRVAPEIAEKVIKYQQECDDVLWQYWTTGRAERLPDFAAPNNLQHGTVEHLEMAGRAYRAVLRSARVSKMAHRQAIRRAGEVSFLYTGINMCDILKMGADEDLAKLIDPDKYEATVDGFYDFYAAQDHGWAPILATRFFKLYQQYCFDRSRAPLTMPRFLDVIRICYHIDSKRKRYKVDGKVYGPHSILYFPLTEVVEVVDEQRFLGGAIFGDRPH